MGKVSRRQIVDIFAYVPQIIGFDISCKLSPSEAICMKCQIQFSGENKKNVLNISKCRLLKILPSMLSIKVRTFFQCFNIVDSSS